MPRRDDLHKILIVGASATDTGAWDELDRAGAEACRILLEEGCEVVVVSSSPATILSEPALATRTYIEPLDVATLTRIIELERPDALLATFGGSAALRLAGELDEAGALERFAVQLIGVGERAVRLASDPLRLCAAAEEAGVVALRGSLAAGLGQAAAAAEDPGLPALDNSPAGWQRFEIEVVRDSRDNAAVVCSIEHVDPLDAWAGAGVRVAPALTLTDGQYQGLRDAALLMARRLGVFGGGVEFAVHPETGVVAVVGVKPYYSTSSAFAAGTTGFPIAATTVRLALGYTLDGIAGIPGGLPTGLEPALDHIAVAMPRRTGEGGLATADRPGSSATDDLPGPPAVVCGHVMAIGRTFKEAFLKALRSRHHSASAAAPSDRSTLRKALAAPGGDRCELLLHGFRLGMEIDELRDLTAISPFFLSELRDIVELEEEVRGVGQLTPDLLLRFKRFGFADRRLGELTGRAEGEVRALRLAAGVVPAFKEVDARCELSGGGSVARYSTYGEESATEPGGGERIVILGTGLSGSAQGDGVQSGCVYAAVVAGELGYEVVVVDCDLGAVSPGGEAPGRLYVEPLTIEDVANVVAAERPKGVVVQFAGRECLGIAQAIAESGVPVLGTSPADLALAGDPDGLRRLLSELGIRSPRCGQAATFAEAEACADRLGYPLIVRAASAPGERSPEIVYGPRELGRLMAGPGFGPGRPAVVEELFDDAIEVGVDAVSDGERVYIGAVVQFIEDTCVVSRGSACIAPVVSLGERALEDVRRQAESLARGLRVRGLLSARFACRAGGITLIEANPWASPTLSFVSRAAGAPMTALALRVILGESLVGVTPSARESSGASAFPFVRLPVLDVVPGVELPPARAVMGCGETLPEAFSKAALAVGVPLPGGGGAFVSVCDHDKAVVAILAARLHQLGFTIFAAGGISAALSGIGVPAKAVGKASRGERGAADLIASGEITLVVDVPSGHEARRDAHGVRAAARRARIPVITTLAAAAVALAAIEVADGRSIDVRCLQKPQRPEEQE